MRPLAIGFFEWVRGACNAAQKRNLATKAVGYAVNQEKELLRFVDDVNLPLDNTRSERALRKIVNSVSLCASSSSTRNIEGVRIGRISTRATSTLAAMQRR